MKRNRPFRAPPRFVTRALSAAAAASAGVAFAALAGCSSAAPLFSPDGLPTTQVQCSAAGGDGCEQQARGMCGGPFEIVRQTTAGGVRNLLFACKKAG
ncbi:hypothetical protein [Paraburkholderia sartisoli]|uniref:Lipoprotein n=1 Tax=Paraburkholderia sartisoli TaxID=83784 RepID=A0A1H4GIA2_9BURK|nr:hypothetical protein [Paraburkholderia sartisoli]SEB09349.1 hypothetical protein SAMN05192564_10665 [Paraburkholderia sartisoli]